MDSMYWKDQDNCTLSISYLNWSRELNLIQFTYLESMLKVRRCSLSYEHSIRVEFYLEIDFATPHTSHNSLWISEPNPRNNW